MSHCVLDCSVAVAWCFEDEASAATDALLHLVARHGALVPAIWHLEVMNVIGQAWKRRRISEQQAADSLARLRQLRLDTVTTEIGGTSFMAVGAALSLGLSAYDHDYLRLAETRGLPLASLDKALRRAAAERNLPLLP